jgi:tryptophan synthase alpha subunit
MEEQAPPNLEWNVDSAELAYSVIARYVEHAQVSGIIIAMLASALGEERVESIAQSGYWQTYMASRRTLTEAQADIEQLTALIERARQQ